MADADAQGKGGGSFLMSSLLPALLAAGAAFGGTYAGMPAPVKKDEKKEIVEDDSVPGPTMALAEFIFNSFDEKNVKRAVKMSVSVELKAGTDIAMAELFVPRMRDAMVDYLRNLAFHKLIDNKYKPEMTKDLLGACHSVGLEDARRILIQQLVAREPTKR